MLILWILLFASLLTNAYLLYEHQAVGEEKWNLAPFNSVNLRKTNITVQEKDCNIDIDGLVTSPEEWNESAFYGPDAVSFQFKYDSEWLYGIIGRCINYHNNYTAELYFKGEEGAIALGVEQKVWDSRNNDYYQSPVISTFIREYRNGTWGPREPTENSPINISAGDFIEFRIPKGYLISSDEDSLSFAYTWHMYYGYLDGIYLGGSVYSMGEPTNFSTYSPMVFEGNNSTSSSSRCLNASDAVGGG